jgi:phage N-6-adenine-methyltransferase
MEKLPGDDGKYRPMHYAARAVELEPEEEPEEDELDLEADGCWNCKHDHYNSSSGGQFCTALGVQFSPEFCPCNMRLWEPEATEEPEPEPKYHIVAANHAETEGDDWCTPPEYVEAVRDVLGRIDLDPATNANGQKVVKASIYHTKSDDGLAQPWQGRVFLNPPYSVPLIDRFVAKILSEYQSGNVTEAIVLTNNSTETQWFQSLLAACHRVCFPARRLKFWKGDNEVFATRQGQAFFYLGNSENFDAVFSQFGTVLRKA